MAIAKTIACGFAPSALAMEIPTGASIPAHAMLFIKEVAIEAPIQIKKQGEDKTIEINRDTAMDMEHADAITIHKSQGSEYDNVYIMLPDKPLSLLTRNMVNTAISRARKCVTLITINDALAIAASNKCKRNRITRLEEKLKNMGEEECQKECQEHVE